MARTIRFPARRRCWKRRECWVNSIARDGLPSAPSSTARGDGEEPGLLGSVEWVENHLDELENAQPLHTSIPDGNERGVFSFPAGPRICRPSSPESRAIFRTPENPHVSLFNVRILASIAKAKRRGGAHRPSAKRSDLLVKAVGDGSDYTAFQDFAGHFDLKP